VHAFNAGLDGFELPIRIGLHAGEIFLGNLGAGGHYEYGVTGDTVNTASRMDGLNKYLGTQILVSAEVIDRSEGMLTREAGSFLLQGKSQPLQVFELLCPLEKAGERQKVACELFAEGLGAFRRRSWAEARRNFQRCIELLGSDRLSQYYLKLCDEYLNCPPDEAWDGVMGRLHYIIACSILGTLSLSSAVLSATPPCAPPVASIESIQGHVEVRREGQTQWHAAGLNDQFCSGDRIQVGRVC
jgi:adenylate cyclase